MLLPQSKKRAPPLSFSTRLFLSRSLSEPPRLFIHSSATKCTLPSSHPTTAALSQNATAVTPASAMKNPVVLPVSVQTTRSVPSALPSAADFPSRDHAVAETPPVGDSRCASSGVEGIDLREEEPELSSLRSQTVAGVVVPPPPLPHQSSARAPSGERRPPTVPEPGRRKRPRAKVGARMGGGILVPSLRALDRGGKVPGVGGPVGADDEQRAAVERQARRDDRRRRRRRARRAAAFGSGAPAAGTSFARHRPVRAHHSLALPSTEAVAATRPSAERRAWPTPGCPRSPGALRGPVPGPPPRDWSKKAGGGGEGWSAAAASPLAVSHDPDGRVVGREQGHAGGRRGVEGADAGARAAGDPGLERREVGARARPITRVGGGDGRAPRAEPPVGGGDRDGSAVRGRSRPARGRVAPAQGREGGSRGRPGKGAVVADRHHDGERRARPRSRRSLRDRDAADPARVLPREQPRGGGRRQIPDTRGAVGAARHDEAPAPRRGDAEGRPGVPGQQREQLPARGVEGGDAAVAAGCGDDRGREARGRRVRPPRSLGVRGGRSGRRGVAAAASSEDRVRDPPRSVRRRRDRAPESTPPRPGP